MASVVIYTHIVSFVSFFLLLVLLSVNAQRFSGLPYARFQFELHGRLKGHASHVFKSLKDHINLYCTAVKLVLNPFINFVS